MLTDSSEDGRDTLWARVGNLCAGGLLDAGGPRLRAGIDW